VVSKELADYIRFRMPLRAKVAGDETIERIVDSVVREWPSYRLATCERGSVDEEMLIDGVRERVMREERHGFLWTIFLTALLSAVIRMALEWWLSRPSHRRKIRIWQEGMGIQA
jgi:hypothetical protein